MLSRRPHSAAGSPGPWMFARDECSFQWATAFCRPRPRKRDTASLSRLFRRTPRRLDCPDEDRAATVGHVRLRQHRHWCRSPASLTRRSRLHERHAGRPLVVPVNWPLGRTSPCPASTTRRRTATPVCRATRLDTPFRSQRHAAHRDSSEPLQIRLIPNRRAKQVSLHLIASDRVLAGRVFTLGVNSGPTQGQTFPEGHQVGFAAR